jgi:hypothetical protein
MKKGQLGILSRILWMKLVVRGSYTFVHCKLTFILGKGGNLNAASRQALMQKLARIEPSLSREQPMYVYSC